MFGLVGQRAADFDYETSSRYVQSPKAANDVFAASCSSRASLWSTLATSAQAPSAASAISHQENRNGRHDTSCARERERRKITGEHITSNACSNGCDRGPELMGREDLPKYDRSAFTTECLRRDLHRWWNRGNPIQAIEDGEDAQAVEREVGKGQHQEAKTAQLIVPEQEPTAVVTVGKPT